VRKLWLGERSAGAVRFYSGREKNLVFNFVPFYFCRSWLCTQFVRTVQFNDYLLLTEKSREIKATEFRTTEIG
jgi:hypothetical protein